MKKKVLGLALMAMALVGFNGMAQDNNKNNGKQTCTQTECQQGMKKEGRPQMNPYEGLNLTDAQKSKLAELDAKRMASHKAKMEAQKAAKQDQKNADKAKKDADRKARMEARKAEKMDYLKEVKAIVGPDQYVVFLENFYVNGGNQGHNKAFMQGNHGKKGMAHFKAGKGQKGQRKGGDRKGGNRNATATNSQS